jgi:RNA-directed DNA polymerase
MTDQRITCKAQSSTAERNSDCQTGHVKTQATPKSQTKAQQPLWLMHAVVERSNMQQAYRRVMANKGAAGVDGIDCTQFKTHLQAHWPSIRTRLLAGQYIPSAVRRVDIPKPQGGVRTLGIPTLQDRLIQQALHQVLQPIFEPEFSDSSYGFRPGRGAQDAVRAARSYIESGLEIVVDIDLEKFFDRVDHDVLMHRIQRKVQDKVVLKLIRRYLQAGMQHQGTIDRRVEGTPQGGPLSPLLSNILLTDLDREIERRGHKFCRYADDCNIYVKSKTAGNRVMTGISRFIEETLKLKVNSSKSAVDRPSQRKFLGYRFIKQTGSTLIRTAPSSAQRFMDKVRQLLIRGRGRDLRETIETLNIKLRGWANYFKLAHGDSAIERLDRWIRRRIRCIIWRQWKRPITRYRNLCKLGAMPILAFHHVYRRSDGPWRQSNTRVMNFAINNRRLRKLGLLSVEQLIREMQCAT